MKKCFSKHCYNCEKFSNHRHTPAEFNAKCVYPSCPCRYFYGWEQIKKRLTRLKTEKLQRNMAMEGVDPEA